jgi:hypothetical protein
MATNQEPIQQVTPEQDATAARPTLVQPERVYESLPAEGRMRSMATADERVRWGAVWAGLLTALTAFILFSVLGLAIGLSNVNGPAVVATGLSPYDAGRNTALWLGVSGFIAFLIGGYVAGRAAVAFQTGKAALHGSLIFFLAVPLLALFGALALGGNLGNLGVWIGHNLSLLQSRTSGDTARNTAWWTLLGLVVALLAGTLGGALATRRGRYMV